MFSLLPSQALQSLQYCIDFELIPSIFPMACPFFQKDWLNYYQISFDCCEKILSNQQHSSIVLPSVLLLSTFFTPLYGKYTYSNGAVHDFPFTKEHMKETWKVCIFFIK